MTLMPRAIDSSMLGGLLSNAIDPAFLVDLTFTNGPAHVWSGRGDLVWNGATYTGVGSLGAIGDVVEGTDVRADGTTIALSGIDSALMNDCLADIQIGAPATIWFALISAGAVLGAPYPLFVGVVDKPTIQIGPDTIAISLALESRMAMLQRPTARRYTAADQNVRYPDDSAFNWVEILNDIALRWGN
jgi:hypothetical protein